MSTFFNRNSYIPKRITAIFCAISRISAAFCQLFCDLWHFYIVLGISNKSFISRGMKKFIKRLTKAEWFQKTVCWLIANYIRLVHYTSRKMLIIDEAAKPYMNGSLPAVYAFWHGRLLMMPMICPPERKMQVMISSHGDGEIIALAMHQFNFGTVRGSTTRGGSDAARNAVKALQAGENVSITPDGPRGPALKVQPGILSIAQIANVPILCAVFGASRHKRARSWDSFMVALPFGKICYHVAGPLFNPTKEELEKKMVETMEGVDRKVLEA